MWRCHVEEEEGEEEDGRDVNVGLRYHAFGGKRVGDGRTLLLEDLMIRNMISFILRSKDFSCVGRNAKDLDYSSILAATGSHHVFSFVFDQKYFLLYFATKRFL